MKKITVALDDSVFISLIDYVASKSKRTRSRMSVSQSASELITSGLSHLAGEEESEL